MKPLLAITIAVLLASDPVQAGPFQLDGFRRQVLPFVEQHCVACRNATEAEGELDLARLGKVDDLLGNRKAWQKVVRQLKAGAIPPDGEQRPLEQDAQAVIGRLEQALVYVDPKQPVDPGRVTVRRLNRTEYDNTVRDLFGVSTKTPYRRGDEPRQAGAARPRRPSESRHRTVSQKVSC